MGQEIVERIRSRGQVRRKFTGFEIDGALPAAGSKVQVEGKDVGEITSVASLPWQAAIGAWRWDTYGVKSLRPVSSSMPGGSAASVASLPFAEIVQVAEGRRNIWLRKSRKVLP